MKLQARSRGYLLFLLPALTLFSVFFLYPFGKSLWLSFTDAYGYRPEIRWIGLQNYREAVSSPYFLESLGVTLRYTLFVTAVGNLTALALALLLDSGVKGVNALRAAYFLPNLMSLIIVGFVWVFLYGSVYRSLINAFHIPKEAYVSWLGNPSLAVYSIGVTAVWQCAGYYMLIYIAALGGIPGELREAASMDGANGWQVLRYVKLPLLAPTFVMNTVLLLTASLKAFDFPMAMTSGGPAGATTTIALLIYNTGFRSNRTGYATAQSVLLFLMIAAVTALLQRWQRRSEAIQ
ncbi:MAG: sugar ABC transporter permease [Candidatus Limiplasma sp.]|nr:sugar ABC transporter permease [Candidatus Limiplasma sp.]